MEKKHTPKPKKFATAYLAGCILMILTLSVVSFFIYRASLQATLLEKVKEDLRRSSDQSTLLVNSIIGDYFKQLEMAASFCGSGAEVRAEEMIQILEDYNQGNPYSQLGVSGLDGYLYTGKGDFHYVAARDYFKQAVSGKQHISGIMAGGANGRDIIVLSQPVRKGNEVVGTVCMEYDIQMFTDLLGNSLSEGMGATLIIQKNGRMISRYEGMESFYTFYDILKSTGLDESSIAQFQKQISSGESGYLTYYLNNKSRYIHFQPAGISDWIVLSIVKSESIDQQFHTITMESLFLMLSNFLGYGLILLCIFFIYRHGKQVTLINQKDGLTQIYNKASGQAAAESLLQRGKGRHLHACFFMDIDNFKGINDKLGHSEGDRLLRNFSRKLTETFRDTDIICRFGGDEFCVWMKNIGSKEVARQKAENLFRLLRADVSFPTTISVGIACFPEDGETLEALQRHADEALYQAKAKGKNQFQFYSKEDKPIIGK